jgi:hypothetical protein
MDYIDSDNIDNGDNIDEDSLIQKFMKNYSGNVSLATLLAMRYW